MVSNSRKRKLDKSLIHGYESHKQFVHGKNVQVDSKIVKRGRNEITEEVTEKKRREREAQKIYH